MLVKDDLNGIVRARLLSRAVMRNIRQNLFFAFVYNAAGVPLAAGVLYPLTGWLLSPIIASAAMAIADGSQVELLDGGYCANNPTLYAIADAVVALKLDPGQLRVVSIGVGNYPEPPRYWHKWVISKFFLVRLLHKTLGINTHSMEQLAKLLFREVPMVRINDTYSTPDMAADLMEHNITKLNILYQRGGESFGNHEDELKQLLA